MKIVDSNPPAIDQPSKSPTQVGLSAINEPIAALGTAPGAAALAVIRLSGQGCLEALERCLQRRSLAEVRPRQVQLAKFIDPRSNETIDELLVSVFHQPGSFTGEDLAELSCHGGPYIVQRILQVLWQEGLRPAEPGEFTKRAFLNGKMDLTVAEGIKELVEASTHQQWLAARQLATGRFADEIERLRLGLIEAMAYLAARIDFPDEGDTQGVDLGMVDSRVRELERRIVRLEKSYSSGRVAAQGLRVVILGPPNMGKSTLLNTLLGHERAIVTAEAGTTRDYLEESCRIRGRLIRLVDTAGIRETVDQIEMRGVEHSRRLAREADLLLLLIAADASQAEKSLIEEMAAAAGSEKCLMILTKADLGRPVWADNLLAVSCHKAGDLVSLEDEIVRRVDGYIGQLNEEPFVSSARHLAALQIARSNIEAFFAAAEEGQYDEVLAFELQHAARALSGILGAVDTEDILDKIFSDFCVGK